MSITNEQIKKADRLYDHTYASLYNDIWWERDYWKPVGDFHVRVLSELLEGSENWLDVGCGTGYFLSKFPHVNRCGLDLSHDMIEKARTTNPGVPFYQQSMTDENTDLNGKFDLVTCTGQPWCYLTSLDEIGTAVKRLAEWTAEGGTCLLTPNDIVDVMDIELPPGFYDLSDRIEVPRVVNLAVISSYEEFDGHYYPQLFPNLDQWIRWFAVYFKQIEILFRPMTEGSAKALRRIIVCREKRRRGDKTRVKITAPSEPLYQVKSEPTKLLGPELSNTALLKELAIRLKSGKLIKAAVKKIIS